MCKIILTIFALICLKGNAQQNWKLSVQTWTFHKYSLYETIDKADSLGLHYIEVYPGQKVGRGINGSFSYQLDNNARDKIKKYLASKKIKVIALGIVDKYYYNKDNLEKFFEFAKYMDIPFITAEPEWKDLDQFNELAAKYGVKIGIHCHPRPASHYWHPDSMYKAMQGRDQVGAWPDLGHWARNGVNIIKALKKLKGKIWGLHFKDVKDFGVLSSPDTLFGRGVCNIRAVLKQLKMQKFNGVISMEYEANEDNNMDDMRKNKVFYEQVRSKL
jgi:sugar phosphate isomerase/epimerase